MNCNAINISLDFDQKYKNLEQPSQLDDQPLHGSQVEEHRDEEVEEVDDGQHLTIRIRTFLILEELTTLNMNTKLKFPLNCSATSRAVPLIAQSRIGF